jgi:bifunctional DNA-binding transcriptional regulator/antitoxin component of YhaV-PrlF toxin-antitoxin module
MEGKRNLGQTYKIKMLGEGIIVLPDEVLKKSKIKKDDEVEFFMGEGWIEFHKVKSLKPFTLAHPLLQLVGPVEKKALNP